MLHFPSIIIFILEQKEKYSLKTVQGCEQDKLT